MSNRESKSTDSELESLRLEYCFDKGIDLKNRSIRISEEIDEFETPAKIDAALTDMESHSKKGITIKIISPGGSTYGALAIVDRIRMSKCKIVTVCLGQVMSAASLILAAGDKRIIGRYAWVMHHEFVVQPPKIVTGKLFCT